MIDVSTLEVVKEKAIAADVFESVSLGGDLLSCTAMEVEATYAVEVQGDAVLISLRTPDRWLSESIEGDLMHTGDKMEELLEDELVEMDDPQRHKIDHYRDEQKRYTFSTLSTLTDPDSVANLLLAYEAMFVQLGDMGGEE